MRKGNKVLANDIIRFFSVVFLIDRKRNQQIALRIATNRCADTEDLANRAGQPGCKLEDTAKECLEQFNLAKLLAPDDLGEKNWEYMTEDEINMFCDKYPIVFENAVEEEDGNRWCMSGEDAGKDDDEAF